MEVNLINTLCAHKKWKPEYMRHQRLKGWLLIHLKVFICDFQVLMFERPFSSQ